MRVTDNNLIVKITIPLVSREYFKMYHIIPIPFEYERSLRIITSYLLPTNEREKCLTYENGQIICKQQQPLYGVQPAESQCEIAVMLHPHNVHKNCEFRKTEMHQFWSSLAISNQYLFITQEPTSVSIICNPETQKTTQQCIVNGSEIMAINQQCIVLQYHYQ